MSNLRRGQRKNARVRQSNILYIFVEGERTEPEYLSNWLENFCIKHDLKYGEIKSRIKVIHPRGSDPLTIVNSALNEKEDSEESDIFFAVFDEDDDGRDVRENENMKSAFMKAKDNNIEVCFSNRCIEFWALLHFRYTSSAMSRDELYDTIKAEMPSYSNTHANKVFEYERMFADGVEEKAIKRAIKLRNEQAENNSKISPADFDASFDYPRPWTNMDFLIMTLKWFIAKNFMDASSKDVIKEEVKSYNNISTYYIDVEM